MSKNILKRAFEDDKYSEKELTALAAGKIKRLKKLNRNEFFIRLLKHLEWYEIIKTVPLDIMAEILTDKFIEKLDKKNVQEGMTFVRQLLREKTLPSSG